MAEYENASLVIGRNAFGRIITERMEIDKQTARADGWEERVRELTNDVAYLRAELARANGVPVKALRRDSFGKLISDREAAR